MLIVGAMCLPSSRIPSYCEADAMGGQSGAIAMTIMGALLVLCCCGAGSKSS